MIVFPNLKWLVYYMIVYDQGLFVHPCCNIKKRFHYMSCEIALSPSR
jgi:hypothetical protein